MTPADIAAALLRTTLATSAAALAAGALLAALRVSSPRFHRIAWLLVIAQGWLFFPLTIEIETALPQATTKRAAGLVPAGISEQETTPFETDAQSGREHFATGESPIVESPLSQKAPDPVPLALAVWLFGAFALVITAARRYVQVIRTLPLGSPPEDPAWQAEWHAARATAKLRRRQPVDLRITTSLGPLLHWAPWAYLILVPRPLWTTLAAPQRQAILRHELAHLRRGDLWKSLAIRVLALPQWFNPLAWLAIRRFDEAAEWACDDAAAATAAGRLTFAESLLQSAEYAVAPFPASVPAARGVLTRRIHRLVSPRFKEESKMKLLLVPMLLVLAAVAQVVRIERVVAEAPQQSPASHRWSLAEEFSVPLAERLEKTKRRHAQLIAERQRHLDAAKSSNLPAAQAVSHSGPPLSQDQIDFDRLTKEFENFASMDYVIEPPDILSIESDKLVPKAPHRLETFDTVQIRVIGAFPEQPIDNNYNVDADGAVNLGLTHGRIAVAGQTIKEAEDAIRAQLSKILTDVNVTVTLLSSSSAQAITGQHLVAMDGRVNLGFYGSVYVTGMTLKEARAAIELKLAEQLDDPKVSVDVLAYNSKVYYVITKGARLGDDVTRLSIPFPVDGKENVAEALARVYDNVDRTLKLKELADASLTLVRPASNGVGLERVYPIVWDASTQAPTLLTNHGMLPGDRIFIELTPAAALPKKACSVKDATGREFIIEPRFVPNVRDSRKAKPTGAEGGSEEPSILSSTQVDEAKPALRYGAYFDDAVPAANHPPATLSGSVSDEKLSAWDQEIAIKRIGNSLLAVRKSAAENASDEPAEDSNIKLKIAPRWLESGRRLQPFDTLRIHVERPHRPAHALTWGDIEGEFTIDHHGELGRQLSAVPIAGLSVDEARAAIARQLRKEFPDCVVHLTLGALAAEKYAISVRRSDGTEIFAGALLADRLSTSAFAQWSQFNHELGPDAEFQLYPANSHRIADGPVKLSTVWDAVLPPGMPATDLTARPGDRLIITVPRGYQPSFVPYWLEPCDAESARAVGRRPISAAPGWRELYSTQFDHPDVQRPAGPKYTR